MTIKHCIIIIIIKHTWLHLLVHMEHGTEVLESTVRRPAILEPHVVCWKLGIGKALGSEAGTSFR